MIQDPYGNYAIQEVIENWDDTDDVDSFTPILE